MAIEDRCECEIPDTVIDIVSERERVAALTLALEQAARYERMLMMAAKNSRRSIEEIRQTDRIMAEIRAGKSFSGTGLVVESDDETADKQSDGTHGLHNFPAPFEAVTYDCIEGLLTAPNLPNGIEITSPTRRKLLDVFVQDPFSIISHWRLSAALTSRRNLGKEGVTPLALKTHICHLRPPIRKIIASVADPTQPMPEILPNKLNAGWSLFPTDLKTAA